MRIDPFDILWKEEDPIHREITLLKSTVDKRKIAGKHLSSEEYLPVENLREMVREPDRIDYSAEHPNRDVYYKYETEQRYPYSRLVVVFPEEKDKGYVISWSRYDYPVSSSGVRWRKK